MRLKAARIALLLIVRLGEVGDGKTNAPSPVTSCSSRRISTACRLSGTRCCCLVFDATKRHSAASRLNSFHSAFLSSPGRTKTSGANFIAHWTIFEPSYASMALSRSPSCLGSVTAAKCFLTILLTPRSDHGLDRICSVGLRHHIGKPYCSGF